MKKILFVIYTYSSGGGAERILSDVVAHLNKDKYDITILPYADFAINQESVPENVKLLPGIVNIEKASKLEKGLKYALVHFFPEVLRKIYIKEKYDFEISFNYQIPSFLVKGNGKTKVIQWNHGDIYNLANQRMARLLQRRSFRRATKIIAISQNTKESICSLYPQYTQKVEMIYNGVNVNRIMDLANERPEIILNDPAIVFLGRLESAKQPMKLLEVVRRLKMNGKKISLYYIGQGEQKKELEKRIADWQLEDRVYLLGFQKNPYPLIKQSRAVCMMSEAEGFPTVFVEGMVLGKPFVSSEVGGVLELSNAGQCGIVVKNIEECVKAIELVALDKNHNSEMGNCCRFHIQKFSMEKQIETIENMLDNM